MATKPLTTETIALTEKKMDMTLDDIIKMSKVAPKGKKQQRRASNKAQNFVKGAAQDKPAKLLRFMDARSSIRQRRSNFQGNQFPIAAEAARKAAVAPLRNRAFNRNRLTLQIRINNVYDLGGNIGEFFSFVMSHRFLLTDTYTFLLFVSWGIYCLLNGWLSLLCFKVQWVGIKVDNCTTKHQLQITKEQTKQQLCFSGWKLCPVVCFVVYKWLENHNLSFNRSSSGFHSRCVCLLKLGSEIPWGRHFTHLTNGMVGAPILQRRAGNVGYGTKLPLPQQQQQQLRQQENALPKQRPQTLDLLFANMKEQRMRAQPRQNNAVPRNIRGVQQRPPWRRGGRFGN
ncbi:hypothetical protein Prudu_020021 [Prunus dulcis]|uniref:Uncharacterized protein n=1 Tax=Prunus dulcis TaxID=3755 RepID=A0A4Y1RUC5_PRUDU|nr:hypothetical protein Prudu_020021 [Prunus dulcis]